MTQDFEYISYNETDRIAMLESRAAELERRLLEVTPPGGMPLWGANTGEEVRPAQEQEGPPSAAKDFDGTEVFGGGGSGGGTSDDGSRGSDGRTEALINRGRQRAKQPRTRWLRAHWRAAAVGTAVVFLTALVLAVVLPGGGASWPASVAQVKTEITTACQNPNEAAEPSQVNFACAKSTQSVLWVFSLLTSGNNPNFTDPPTGRKGLEPIQPNQGGDIAWSLNLHHPYDPANPIDSLEVAARAINNIIGGATLTSTSGAPLVEPGLESKAANCQRYTGSSQLAARQGFPARCARLVTSQAGQEALVSDVFQQWMGGTPTQVATQAGVLFENADNPGNPQVQAILAGLSGSGVLSPEGNPGLRGISGEKTTISNIF
jgi:hypothetical protein